jgi:plasmid replication initiation protein
LERYPWARLSDDKGDQLQLSLLIDKAGEEGRAWMVSAKHPSRLPGPFDADVYVALGQLHNAQIPREKRGELRTVQTTFRELASLMGRELGGTTYTAIRGGLDRLADVAIQAVQTWREGETVAEEKRFHLLESVTYRHRRDGEEGGTVIVVRFAEEVAQSIAEGQFRLLDTAKYFTLDTPTAKRLYRFLDARRWRGADRQDVLTLPLKELAEHLPIDREAPSHIKRTLNPAHAALIADGYLATAEYQEVPVPDKKRPAILVRYEFATPEAREARKLPPGARLATADARTDPEYVRNMVAEIIGTLRDEHSMGFYVSVVRALPEEVLRNVLGGTRQAIREGLTIELARKTFTASAKARAKAISVPL